MILPKHKTSSRQNKQSRPAPKERKAAYDLAAQRSGGWCEACGSKRAEHMHHRQYRSRGGEDIACNLLHLCLSCHADAHTLLGDQMGWSCSAWENPEEKPVVHARFGLITLDNQGGYEAAH